MPDNRTPARWTYRGSRPQRATRVVRTQAPRGVQKPERAQPVAISAGQARLAIAMLLVAMFAASAWWLYRSPYMTLHEIEVRGAARLAPQDILQAAGLDGASGFTADTAAAERRVEALPGVRDAAIEQHGWTGATITIVEREPWGGWSVNGAIVPIDAEGYVLDGAALPVGAPVIVEVEPQGAINAGDRLDAGAVQLAARLLAEADTAFGRSVLGLAYRQSAGLTAVLSPLSIDEPPLWVTFGDSRDYDYKVAALYVLLEQAREEQLKLRAVDLRFGSRLSFQ